MSALKWYMRLFKTCVLLSSLIVDWWSTQSNNTQLAINKARIQV